MHYEIYIDVVFCINFVMDYIMLSITDGILKCNKRPHRIAVILRRYAAALAGALWVCAIIVFRLYKPVWNIVSYIPVCAVMVMITVGVRSPVRIIKGVGVMYITACLLGGFVHIIYYYTAFGYIINSPSNRVYAASIWHIVAAAVLFTPIVRYSYREFFVKISMRKFIYHIEVGFNGRNISLDALCDTGNSLTDPYNGEPVNIICADCLGGIIGDITGCGYHLIPYNAIGKPDGLIPVVRLDRLIIYDEKKELVIDKPLFALYSGGLTKRGEYRAIVHPAMMSGTKG